MVCELHHRSDMLGSIDCRPFEACAFVAVARYPQVAEVALQHPACQATPAAVHIADLVRGIQITSQENGLDFCRAAECKTI